MGAVASLGLLASCSSDDDLSTGGNGKDGLQKIKIGMGVQANVATRGTGTVGAVGEKENTWAKQAVNVYMLNKGTLDLAKFGEDPIYENTVLTTPADNASGIASELDENGVAQYKYYPTTNTAFDFWGYRLDDANDATGTADQEGTDSKVAVTSGQFVPYTSGDSLLIGFKIDGTQDIMAGKAVPTEEEITKCGGENNIYSAFAARREVQPNIKFEHLLSRLNFQVLDGKKTETTDPDKAVKVTGITVKSKATGKLVIAYKGAAAFENVSDQLIVDKDADTEKDAALLKELEVKQRADGAPLTQNLEALEPVTPKWNNGMAMATQVGEALLAIPADKYEITINLKQKVQVKGDKLNPQEGDFEEKPYTYTADLKNTVNPEKGFEPGYSYNVTITVYGLSEIVITTTLTPWKDGGNIEMNPEDETFGATTANNAYEWAALEGDPTTSATVEATTYESLEALKAAVAANASNSGKIYKVGSTETGWTYYQCKVKVTTPAPTVKYEFDTYEFQEGDVVEAGEFADLDALKAAVTASETTEGKIYKVGTSEPYSYYKVTKHVTGA